jgi:class 3 adenylate cyclase/hemoglobin-like flavoprotein
MTMQLRYQGEDKTVTVEEPRRTLLDASISARIPHWCECGGHGRCTTCRVKVVDGADNLTPQTPVERRMADLYGWETTTRLACQARLLGDATIERLVTTGADATQLQIDSLPNRAENGSDLAVLVCNIRHAESSNGAQSPADMVDVMNRYFTTAGDPILLNNGVIHQYVGTAVTGLFGHAGDTPESACQLATRAAFGINEGVERLNETLDADGKQRLLVGIAVHYGSVTVNRVGHPSLRQISVIGDTVEAANEMQAIAPASGSGILFSATVIEKLPPGTLALDANATPTLANGHGPLAVHQASALAAPDSLAIAQETLNVLFDEPERLARIFYDRLFQVAPHLRTLFSSDMESQILALDHMLRSIIYALTRPEQLSMGLRELGNRHIGYGVKFEHYDVIRVPLLGAIDEALGDQTSPKKIAAWETAINQVLALMRDDA